jgi:hypothetical protein
MNAKDIVNNTPSDPRTKIIILLSVGFLSFLICFGYWIYRLISLSQREKNKNFKNSLWLTFFLPWGFAIPLIYMSTLGMIASYLGGASWWVHPTIIFSAVDVAFLGAGIVGGFLPGKEEGEEVHSPKEREALPESTFTCGICAIKYSEGMFGAETIKEGKICKPCLGRKQQGIK